MRTSLSLLGLVIVGLMGAAIVQVGSVQADAPTPTANATTATKKHHHHRIHGKITSIDGASITIKVHHHKKKTTATGTTVPTTAATTETKTFKLDDKVKVFRMSETGKTAALSTDLQVGARVAIGEHEGVAQEIRILPKHHKKKTTTATT